MNPKSEEQDLEKRAVEKSIDLVDSKKFNDLDTVLSDDKPRLGNNDKSNNSYYLHWILVVLTTVALLSFLYFVYKFVNFSPQEYNCRWTSEYPLPAFRTVCDSTERVDLVPLISLSAVFSSVLFAIIVKKSLNKIRSRLLATSLAFIGSTLFVVGWSRFSQSNDSFGNISTKQLEVIWLLIVPGAIILLTSILFWRRASSGDNLDNAQELKATSFSRFFLLTTLVAVYLSWYLYYGLVVFEPKKYLIDPFACLSSAPGLNDCNPLYGTTKQLHVLIMVTALVVTIGMVYAALRVMKNSYTNLLMSALLLPIGAVSLVYGWLLIGDAGNNFGETGSDVTKSLSLIVPAIAMIVFSIILWRKRNE